MLDSRQAHISLSMLAVLYALGFTNLFLRNSLGILAPELRAEMQLSPADLSIVASSFFLAYAAMQLPSGMLLDRFGARRTLAVLLIFTTVGAALFAMSEDLGGLVTARILMGIGCAGIFSGAFFVINQFVAPEKIVTQSGILNSFAAVGGLCATAPLAALLVYVDWRDAYLAFTVGVFVLLIAVALCLAESPAGRERRRARSETVSAVFSGVARAFVQPGMRRLIVVGVPISTQTTLLGVWGAPYLRDVHNLDDIARGNVMLAMAVAGVFGHSFFGFLARRLNSIRNAILTGGSIVFGLTVILVLWERPPVWVVASVFATIGFAAMYPMIAFAHARSLVPAELVGRGVSVTNMGIMSAIAFSQLIFGWVIGAFAQEAGVAPEIAYRTAFAVLAAMSLAALLIYAPTRDGRPQD